MREDETIIIWDLDHTLFNAECAWFGPALDDFVHATGMDRAVIEQAFAEANRTGFTFKNWFNLAGLDPARLSHVEGFLTTGLIERAAPSIYPGVINILDLLHYSVGHRQVLVTAGDPDWQMWKFQILNMLHLYFRPEDRHFVTLDGSKAEVVARYVTRGRRVTFADDSPRWLHEVHCLAPDVRLVRPMWPDTAHTDPHPDDGRLWCTFTTSEELWNSLH